MQYSTFTFAALTGLATTSSAHMIMTTPTPYGKSSLNNSPLAADGSDYPCKLRGTTFEMEDPSNVMAIGSSQSLHFRGTAVHGGGSCQVSIAMLPEGKTLSTLSDSDAKSLNFKVIHSIVGGCPEQGLSGNSEDAAAAYAVDPSTYPFTIPHSVPAGNATLAWTWFNKVGNREMYMNCAPVTITSAPSKRGDHIEERDISAFNSLPDMFTANIGNQCTTADSKDVVFPNPGDSVVEMGGSTASTATAAPTGAGCQASSAAGGGATATGVASTAAHTSSIAAVVASSTTLAAASASSAGSGVFVTTPSSPFAKPSITSFTTAIATATASAAKISSATAAAVATGSPITPGTSCTTEGMYNCVSNGAAFQQCASGTWSVTQAVAPGTACSVGQSMDIAIHAVAVVVGGGVKRDHVGTSAAAASRRGLRNWPREHIRRHLVGSV